jgi:pSer/pThr/pTyr-binding forkhead associated (FHA) protein
VANTLFCSECGSYLLEEEGVSTDPLEKGQTGWTGETTEQAESPLPVKDVEPSIIRLKIDQTGREIQFKLDRPLHLGRLDPASETFPEIDLSNDKGVEKGVSRRHARILKRDESVVVEDTGSINGTFLNGKRMAPHLPEILYHGDHLQLGKLLIRVAFE